MKIQALKNEYNVRVGVKNNIETNLKNKKQELDGINEYLNDLKESRILVQETARKTQNELEYSISKLVTECLQNVFDEPIKMKVRFTPRRGRTEVDILLVNEVGMEIIPRNSDGAGLVDIMSLGLKAVMHTLQDSQSEFSPSPLFILDEPFKKLNDPERTIHKKAAEIIENISKELGIQMIIVTLLPEMKEIANTTYEVKKINNVSQAKISSN